MTEFDAELVGAGEIIENNCFVLVIAEHFDGSGQRLELQAALSYDEQDQSLSMDTYCLCTETGACHYGGVTSWTLIEDQAVLVVTLDEAASRVLDVAGGLRVKVPRSDVPIVRESLQRILAA